METTNRELTPQNCIDMYCYIKNDEENIFEGKGKGGKGQLHEKRCNIKQLVLKEQYLSKLKGDEKRCFRFLQLDQTQSMTCKIDAPKRCGSDDHFIDKLLEMFEGSYEYVTAKAEENCRGDEGTGG